MNREKFPNGLGELIDKVHELGMDFGIWVSRRPSIRQRPVPGAPGLGVPFRDAERSELRNQLLLNISKPEVKAYIVQFMTDPLEKHDIKFIKWDMNRP